MGWYGIDIYGGLLKAFKSKTLWFALLLAVLGAVQASTEALTDVLSPSAAGWVTMGVGVAIAVLRVLTTIPLDEK